MKTKRALPFILFIALTSVLVLLSACQSTDVSQPPEIRYGEDVCEECKMIISEPRFAAAYYTPDGTARHFDDLSGMCIYHNKHEEEVATFWVHDYDTEEWIDAKEATYVMSEEIHTPMGYGVVAFAETDRAEALAAESSGMLMTFDQVMEHYTSGETTGEHNH